MKKELWISLALGVAGLIWIAVILIGRPAARTQSEQTPDVQAKTSAPVDITSHNTPEDCWVTIDNAIYDVTSYIPDHPGGAKSIEETCGGNATEAFETRNGKGPHSDKSRDLLEKYRVAAN